MIDLWTFGVLGFLAIVWSVAACAEHYIAEKARREREEWFTRFWTECIREVMDERTPE